MKSDIDYHKFQFVAEVLKGKVPEAKKFMKNPKDVWQHFAFKIRPGSSLAMNKWQQSLIAMQMYQAQPKPLIDRLGVLETMDWPGRSDILARLEQEEAEEMAKQAEMMKVQADLQAQSGAGGGGGSIPSGVSGGSAPAVGDINSPHAAQGMQEGVMKANGGLM